MKKDYYKALDFYLDWHHLHENINLSGKEAERKEQFKRDNELSDREMLEIYSKLIRDGYMWYDEKDLSKKEKLTLEGYLFVQAGKYEQKNINDARLASENESRLKRMERNEERLVDWTRYLAAGTFLLVAVETVIHWHDFSRQIAEWFSCSH